MSRCSKKCNELKQRIDSISGLDDEVVYGYLCEIDKQIDLIQIYADEDELNGTCFKNKYYHRINDLDIALEKTNHEYIMIHKWAKDNSYKWGIAVFENDKDEDYWYLRTYDDNLNNIDWYDFGCLVKLGYKWIKELGWNE